MTYTTLRIQYPEGDTQEINHQLRVNQLVDINGHPVTLPLQTSKTIVYRVYRKSTQTSIGEEIITYALEQLTLPELESISKSTDR